MQKTQLSWMNLTTGEPYSIDHFIAQNNITSRFRQVPSFGRDTIRKFSSNTSEMKKLGARDFEDILQVGCQEL